MKPAAFDLTLATSLDQALAALAGEGAKPVSGGCSLGPMLNLRLARPAALVDLRRVGELRTLTRGTDFLEIGAGWTHAEIEDGVVPDVTAGLMRRVAHGIAYRAVRNRGTIGGSLAHADPAADWISTLSVLDARLVIRSKAGTRESAMGDFMIAAYTTTLQPDEVLAAVRVPVLSAGAKVGYHKLCRKTGEFAQAIGAVVVDGARGFARVVAGAVEAPPLVLPGASEALGAGDAAGALAKAEEEIEAALAGHPEAFRAIHKVAVARAFSDAGIA
ncbi:FAD binding domain-containing protein [Xanthobacter dioxanivorans]|uniref:FAD binding domain-containing protein n=1 Tax=Xanthobacter dioxanivorans TaxID=2528964 RepID=A0A974SHR5_9HYPH|nr:FAD binding domain-containing protein [Xanthobacter dioxanivorans]QRG05950.1 FAD binding domain-containing protein [Xanthobacter dioxanivorans]